MLVKKKKLHRNNMFLESFLNGGLKFFFKIFFQFFSIFFFTHLFPATPEGRAKPPGGG